MNSYWEKRKEPEFKKLKTQFGKGTEKFAVAVFKSEHWAAPVNILS